MAKVFVKNIPFEAQGSHVIEALRDYGPISYCNLNPHNNPQKRKKNWNSGSGYVGFENEQDAMDCIARTPFDSLRPKCMGRPLHILPIKTKKKVESTSADMNITNN